MRTKPHVRLFVFLSLSPALFASTAHAQAPDGRAGVGRSMSRALSEQIDGSPLSLADAIRQAIDGNRDLSVARRQVDPLRTRPAAARALPAPMVEAQVWQWPVNTLNPANTDMYMFTASQELPGRGKRTSLAKLAETDVRIAEATVSARERDVIAAVADTYWQLVVARRAITIHLANVDLLHELTNVAEAKYSAGRSSQQDVLKAIVETTMLHDDLIELEEQAAEARAHLNALLNRTLDTPIGRLDERGERALTVSVEDLQTLAASGQPDLGIARAQIQRAEAQQNVARTTGLRDWSVGTGYMLRPREADAWMARLAVTWPGAPWAKTATAARTAEAVANVSLANAEAAATKTRVQLDVAGAYIRVKTAEARAALVRTTLLPQSRQALDASRIAYEADRLDFLAVVESERTLLDAELRYERLLDEWRRAFADLERAIGSPIPATMVRPVSLDEAQR